MNKFSIKLIIILSLFISINKSYAQTPEQECQARKNIAAGTYINCRHIAESKLANPNNTKKYNRRISSCSRKFNRKWQSIINQTEDANATCLDDQLTSSDYKSFIDNSTNEIADLLGKSNELSKIQQNCRKQKNKAVGKYVLCRHKAESKFVKNSNANKYASAIEKCENTFQRKWQQIITNTLEQNAICFDDSLTVSDYKTIIDNNTAKVVKALSGIGQLVPIELTISGSPLNLVIEGSAQSITITNTSTIETANDIRADFSGTALVGKVTESSNNCEELAPLSSCTISFTPGDSLVTLTSFNIIGTNTETTSASIAIVGETPSLTVSGSPLALSVDGSDGILTITNNSANTNALNITASFTGTALAGKVLLSGNTCTNVAPNATCTLTFTPGDSTVTTTSFSIQGTNTNSSSASIRIVPKPTLSIAGSPMTLEVNGATDSLTITNTSTEITATNILSDFTGTALDGNVTESINTCATLAPGASCTITYTPGSSVVANTNFDIQGNNTEVSTASIEIESGSTLTAVNANSGSASGGTGVTLTGTGLTGATAITFDGTPATSVNVVNSTTVTAVTPAHVAGVVDVVIDTPLGGATLDNGFTYVATTVGQASFGGTIACLDGGLQNLIAATSDNGIPDWGGHGTAIGAGGQSDTDGAGNTSSIVAGLGAGTYATRRCNDYEVDSQGNTPCEAGNTCYNDWFLPARDQLNCLYTNQVSIGGFSPAPYWSSTESTDSPAFQARIQLFDTGTQTSANKNTSLRIRCVRAFVP
jgi:hypothetical protein